MSGVLRAEPLAVFRRLDESAGDLGALDSLEGGGRVPHVFARGAALIYVNEPELIAREVGVRGVLRGCAA